MGEKSMGEKVQVKTFLKVWMKKHGWKKSMCKSMPMTKDRWKSMRFKFCRKHLVGKNMGEKGTGENFVESMGEKYGWKIWVKSMGEKKLGEKSMCEKRWVIKKHGWKLCKKHGRKTSG